VGTLHLSGPLPILGEEQLWFLYQVIGLGGKNPAQIVYSLYLKKDGAFID
jgi:hypothetical protein